MSSQISRLADLCEIRLGKTPARNNKKYWDEEKSGENVWLSIADLANATEKYVEDSKEYISAEGAKLFKPVKAGTLLMSFKLTIGRLAFAKKDLYTNEAIVALPLKDKGKLLAEYLYYYLQMYDWEKETENDIKLKGRTLNKAKLNEIPVVVHPLPVQKQIVAKLDAAFANIDKAISVAQRNADNAKALFQSYLTEIFERGGQDWKRTKVGALGVVKSGGTPAISKTAYWGDKNGIEWFSSGELNGLYTLPSIRRVTAEGILNSNAKVFPSNSLLIGMYDTAAMKMSLLSAPAAFNQAIVGIEPTEHINMIFLYYALSHIKPFALSLRRGVRQKNLSLAKIKDLDIQFPSIQTQNSIAENLICFDEAANKLRLSYTRKNAEYNKLKQAILKQAFNGELV